MPSARAGEVFHVTGWQGGTVGLRFGSENAARFVSTSWKALQIELDGSLHAFRITGSFWRKCPEVRGAAIKDWLRQHALYPWPPGTPPKITLVYLGGNTFRALPPG
jgi:hypothetical protein